MANSGGQSEPNLVKVELTAKEAMKGIRVLISDIGESDLLIYNSCILLPIE